MQKSSRYLQLLTEEHAIIKKERELISEFAGLETAEREAFHQLSNRFDDSSFNDFCIFAESDQVTRRRGSDRRKPSGGASVLRCVEPFSVSSERLSVNFVCILYEICLSMVLAVPHNFFPEQKYFC